MHTNIIDIIYYNERIQQAKQYSHQDTFICAKLVDYLFWTLFVTITDSSLGILDLCLLKLICYNSMFIAHPCSTMVSI